MPHTVTISASYGAAGDTIARALAARLDLEFIDRAIPAAAAHDLALSTEVNESVDEHVPNRWERMVMGFAHAATPVGPMPAPPEMETLEQFRAEHKAMLRKLADTTGGIVLGRAGMVILKGRPDVLCVRLDGPVQARIDHVVAQGIDVERAQKGQRDIDRARDEYAHVFFNVHQDDPRLYHVILDSTALSTEACVDIIARAAADRFGS